MNKTEVIDKLIKEINMLRLLQFQTMMMWREDRTGKKFNSAELPEVVVDWEALAVSLDKKQWLAGTRAIFHFTQICRTNIWSETAEQMVMECPFNQCLLNRSEVRKFKKYVPPKMKSERLLKAGISRIRLEFGVPEDEVKPDSHGATTGAFA